MKRSFERRSGNVQMPFERHIQLPRLNPYVIRIFKLKELEIEKNTIFT